MNVWIWFPLAKAGSTVLQGFWATVPAAARRAGPRPAAGAAALPSPRRRRSAVARRAGPCQRLRSRLPQPGQTHRPEHREGRNTKSSLDGTRHRFVPLKSADTRLHPAEQTRAPAPSRSTTCGGSNRQPWEPFFWQKFLWFNLYEL